MIAVITPTYLSNVHYNFHLTGRSAAFIPKSQTKSPLTRWIKPPEEPRPCVNGIMITNHGAQSRLCRNLTTGFPYSESAWSIAYNIVLQYGAYRENYPSTELQWHAALLLQAIGPQQNIQIHGGSTAMKLNLVAASQSRRENYWKKSTPHVLLYVRVNILIDLRGLTERGWRRQVLFPRSAKMLFGRIRL